MYRSRSALLLLLSLWSGFSVWVCPVALAEGEDDPLWNRPSFEKKVFRVAQRILSANGIPDRIEFLTSRLDIRNASARRFGGPNTVVIYKDMLDVMESDDELAAVLSHEIAHITKRHTGKIVPRKWAAKTALWTAYTVGGTAASVATAGLAAPVFIVGAAGIKKMHRNGIAITDPISRPYEKEADLVGLDYMVKAGYNPLAMESLLLKGAADSGPVANFFSSHPGGSERLAYIHEAIQSRYSQYLAEDSQSAPTSQQVNQGKQGQKAQGALESPSAQVDVSGGHTHSALDTVTETKANQAASKVKETSMPGSDSLKQQTEKNILQHSDTPPTAAALTQPDKSSPTKGVAVNKSAVSAVVAKQTGATTTGTLTSAKAMLVQPLSEGTGQSRSEQSVAQVLLSLQPDQLRILRMINQHGYLSRQELSEQMEYVPPESLVPQIRGLIQKRLIRILGAEPDEVLVLTDWAAEAFKPEPATH